MSDNDTEGKRTMEEIASDFSVNKKQKLSNESSEVISFPIGPMTPLLEAQEDVIGRLAHSNNTSTHGFEDTQSLTNKMEDKSMSADLINVVTPLANALKKETENGNKDTVDTAEDAVVDTAVDKPVNKPAEDDTITSEQLLFALTSVPPIEDTNTMEDTDKVSLDKDTMAQETKVPANLLSPTTIPLSDTSVDELREKTATESDIPDITTSQFPPSLPSTPTRTDPASTAPLPSIVPTHSIPTKSNPSSLPQQHMTLPDISAALRRLSGANHASVMEQFSPRLPHLSNINERTEASPSEILGNALAAVAASANAARSSNELNAPSSAAATAIGNLAAITANISNFLNSSGFQRNSFSQEDTQKIAAAVARNSTSDTYHNGRKSSMAAIGTAFSSIFDQALMMNKQKNEWKETELPKPKLIIKNEEVWKSIEGMEERLLGFHLYSPHLLLPNLEHAINGILEIRVPACYLTYENMQLKKRALWGTDIYTDDSDIVAMAIHAGHYQPKYIEPDMDTEDPFALAVAGKSREASEATKRLALSGKKWICKDTLIPEHDLKITVRVLPKLQNYASSIRHRIKSREWGYHDGVSLYIMKAETMEKGDARIKGRSSIKSNMFDYEVYRKQALGSHHKPAETVPSITTEKIQGGRIKKTRRVMRMFQMRSELLHSSK